MANGIACGNEGNRNGSGVVQDSGHTSTNSLKEK